MQIAMMVDRLATRLLSDGISIAFNVASVVVGVLLGDKLDVIDTERRLDFHKIVFVIIEIVV